MLMLFCMALAANEAAKDSKPNDTGLLKTIDGKTVSVNVRFYYAKCSFCLAVGGRDWQGQKKKRDGNFVARRWQFGYAAKLLRSFGCCAALAAAQLWLLLGCWAAEPLGCYVGFASRLLGSRRHEKFLL